MLFDIRNLFNEEKVRDKADQAHYGPAGERHYVLGDHAVLYYEDGAGCTRCAPAHTTCFCLIREDGLHYSSHCLPLDYSEDSI